MIKRVLMVFVVMLLFFGVYVVDVIIGVVQCQLINWQVIVMFLIFVVLMLYIIYWVLKWVCLCSDYYIVGGNIIGFQNGLVIVGDFMLVVLFFGIFVLVYIFGYDGLIYLLGFFVGWLIILFLIVECLCNFGCYIFVDVVFYCLKQGLICIFFVCGLLVVVVLYLIVQMVGVGKLIQLLFGFNYYVVVVLVGVLMVFYVLFGGMLVIIWVQIIKVVLLLCGVSFMVFMVMKYVGFSFNNLFIEVMVVYLKGVVIMSFGGLVKDLIFVFFLGLGLMFGIVGLLYILMCFFIVSDVKEVCKSVFYVIGFMGYFYILIFIIGFGVIMLVGVNLVFKDVVGQFIGGNNMVVVYLVDVVGGNLFFGFIFVVVFVIILVVVVGLIFVGVLVVLYDLYVNVFCKGVIECQELKVFKIIVLIFGVVVILLGILFENQNIVFMVGLVFFIVVSCNFLIILLLMYWLKLIICGVMVGGWLGLLIVVILMIFGFIIWVQIFGYEKVLFLYEYLVLFFIVIVFIGIWVFFVIDNLLEGMCECEQFCVQFICL